MSKYNYNVEEQVALIEKIREQISLTNYLFTGLDEKDILREDRQEFIAKIVAFNKFVAEKIEVDISKINSL